MSVPPVLLVHPEDEKTPIDALRIETHVKIEGYLREYLEKAGRQVSWHVRKGDAYLVRAT